MNQKCHMMHLSNHSPCAKVISAVVTINFKTPIRRAFSADSDPLESTEGSTFKRLRTHPREKKSGAR